MKKDKWREPISCFLYVIALFSFLGGITAESRGSLLDFSDLARVIFCGIAVVCVIAAALIWKAKDARGKKIKYGIMIGALVVIIGGGILDTMFGGTTSATLESVSLNMPFRESDIVSVEAYHYDGVPVNSEKKEITEAEDVSNLYELFNSLELKVQEVEELTGASVTSFRFNLTDGTSYEIVYVGVGVKSGKIKISGGSNYFTSADIGHVWENLSYTAVPASESELPTASSVQANRNSQTMSEEAVVHDLSAEGEMLVSESIEKGEIVIISPEVFTNSEEVSVTNNSGADLTIYLYSFGEVIRQMSLSDGEEKTFDGLNGTFPYKIGVGAEDSVQVELIVTD